MTTIRTGAASEFEGALITDGTESFHITWSGGRGSYHAVDCMGLYYNRCTDASHKHSQAPPNAIVWHDELDSDEYWETASDRR